MASKRNLEEVEFIDSPSVPSNLNEAPFTVPETMFQYIGRVLEKPTSMSILNAFCGPKVNLLPRRLTVVIFLVLT